MKTELNFCTGDQDIKADSFKVSLEPNIIRMVKLLARKSAEEDFKEANKSNRH